MVSRIVYGATFVAALALAGFILFLTFTNDQLLVKGFVIAGGILLVGLYPLYKAIKGESAGEGEADNDP